MRGYPDDPRAAELGKILVSELLADVPGDQVAGRLATTTETVADRPWNSINRFQRRTKGFKKSFNSLRHIPS